jgi:hypothetical protein
MPDSLPTATKPKNTFIRDTEKVLEVASKILMPVLLLVLGTWFNYQMNSNQEKQRALEQQQADKQRRSELVESYIKHLTSQNPMERQLALQIMSLESDRFDVQLVNLVSAYASVAPPAERLTALQALSHATHSNNADEGGGIAEYHECATNSRRANGYQRCSAKSRGRQSSP